MNIIRDIVNADLDTVIGHVKDYHAQTVMNRYRFDAVKTYSILVPKLTDPYWYMRIAVDDNDQILGGLCGSVQEYPFNHDLYACDLLFYVIPEHRSWLVATSLVVDYKRWAKSLGAREVRLGTYSGLDMERFYRFAEKLGFNEFGRTHSMEI